MSNPLVSAVIIFLDAEKFIAQSIESVLAQSYPEIELILVDDGSSDGSADIVRTYLERFPGKVKLFEHPGRSNQGMSASRNLGVQHSKGEYIAFLDADDLWLPEKTEQQLAIFRGHAGLGLVYGRTQIWHSWAEGQSPDKDFFHGLGVTANAVYAHPSLLGNLIENRFQTPTTCNAMISRKAFDEVGGFETRFRRMYEDQVFFAKLYLSFPTYVSDFYWARYRQHAGNSGSRFSRLAYFRERAELMEFISGYSRRHWSTLDARTRDLIRRDLWRARCPRIASWVLAMRARIRNLRRR